MSLMNTFYTHAAAHATVVCGNIGCLCGDFLRSYVWCSIVRQINVCGAEQMKMCYFYM